MQTPADSSASPVQIGPFVVSARIGAGGMGEVYRARHAETGESVAIKLLRHEGSSEAAIGRFHREAMVGANIDHPAVVRVLDIGEVEQGCYMAMELVDGQSLRARLESGPLPIDEAVTIAIEIGEALDAAHHAGVIHRDVKPSNILVDTTGRVRLLDFGIAHLGTGQNLTRTGEMIGTPRYMAPEQLRASRKDLDARTDVWGLGIVLYELLTGAPPFDGDNVFALIETITRGDAEPVRARRPEVPVELERTLMRALARDPEQRFHSAQAFADALSGKAPVPAAPAPPASTRTRRGSRASERPETRRRPVARTTGARRRSGAYSGRGGGLPTATIALVCLIAALVAGASLMAFTGDDPPPAEPSPGPPGPVATDPPKPPPPPADPLAEQIATVRAMRADTPAQRRERLDAWRALAGKAMGSPRHEAQIQSQLAADALALERAARSAFEAIRERTRPLLERGQLAAALALWDDFDPALREGWTERIASERSRIRSRRGPTRPGPLQVPDWPTPRASGGKLLVKLDAQLGVPGRQIPLEPRDAPMTLWMLYEDGQGKLRGFREVYLSFEMQLVRGELTLRLLDHQAGTDGGRKVNIRIAPSSAAWATHGSWNRLHIVYQDGTARYWLEGAREEFTPIPNLSTQPGFPAILVPVGSKVEIRDLRVRVGRLGAPIE